MGKVLSLFASIGFYAIQMTLEILYWRRRSSFESGQQQLKRATGLDLYAAPLPYLARLVLTIIFIGVTAPDWMAWFRLTPASTIVTVVVAVATTAVWIGTRTALRTRAKIPASRLLRYLAYCVIWIGGVEELMFRGVLLLGSGGGVAALVLTSAAHSVWHFQWYRKRTRSYALAFGFSLIFGTLTLLTGSLWPAIAMHGLGDFLGNPDRA